MSETLSLDQDLKPQLAALAIAQPDALSAICNLVAALWQATGYHWVGVYRVFNGQLVLGPFQGPIACTVIQKGKGVCGTAWATASTQLVPDVEQFPGHIACSALSRSEMVVPIMAGTEVIGVLDVDSIHLDDFNPSQQALINYTAQLLGPLLHTFNQALLAGS